jgi:Protein of unknown function (DUF2971)
MTTSSMLRNFPGLPTPPHFLYKYLVAERADDVLQNGMVRFTHLLNTNDSFEVRTTFKQFAGPRFQAYFLEEAHNKINDSFVNAAIEQAMVKAGLTQIPSSFLRNFAEQELGQSLTDVLKQHLPDIVPMVVQNINSRRTPEEWLSELGGQLLCFSLSERADSAPMWAHYAGGHTGFVMRFRSQHDWFARKDGSNKSRLQKVSYIDGQLDEPLEDAQAAFISKKRDWEYEREWRLNCGVKDIEKTIPVPDDPIHLIEFPADAVDAIIVGEKSSQDTVGKIQQILERKYPHAGLFRAFANRRTHTFDLVPI